MSLGVTQVKLHIWEAGGSPHLLPLITSYYKAAKGVVLVFDPLNFESCEYAKRARELVPEANVCVAVAHTVASGEPSADITEFFRTRKTKLVLANAKESRSVDSVFCELCEECIQSL